MIKPPKQFWFLFFGFLFYLTDCLIDPSVYFPSSGGRGYTLGGMIGVFVTWPPVLAMLIIGIPCLLIALCRRNYRKCLLVFSILFFAAGLIRAGGTILTRCILQPKIHQQIDQLVRDGKMELPDRDPRENLLGHWVSEDDLTHLYFSAQGLIIVNLGQQKDVKYSIEDFSVIEGWIKFDVSGADYVPHTRTMYFLGDGTAWQVMESSLGQFKSKLKYVGPEQSP